MIFVIGNSVLMYKRKQGGFSVMIAHQIKGIFYNFHNCLI